MISKYHIKEEVDKDVSMSMGKTLSPSSFQDDASSLPVVDAIAPWRFAADQQGCW